jgi:hypothetical protein
MTLNACPKVPLPNDSTLVNSLSNFPGEGLTKSNLEEEERLRGRLSAIGGPPRGRGGVDVKGTPQLITIAAR